MALSRHDVFDAALEARQKPLAGGDWEASLPIAFGPRQSDLGCDHRLVPFAIQVEISALEAVVDAVTEHEELRVRVPTSRHPLRSTQLGPARAASLSF